MDVGSKLVVEQKLTSIENISTELSNNWWCIWRKRVYCASKSMQDNGWYFGPGHMEADMGIWRE